MIDVPDFNQFTPLHYVCFSTQPASIKLKNIKYLLSKNSNVNAISKDKKTPLFVYLENIPDNDQINVTEEDLNCIKELIPNDINTRDTDGWTALDIVCTP